MSTRRLAVATLLAAAPSLVLAAPVAAPAVTTPSITGELVRVVLSLGEVVGVILLAGWMGRRAQSRVRAGGRRLRCLETLAVGAKERVLLIEAGDRQLLVGVAPGHMRTLMVLDQPLVEAETAAAAPAPANFRDLLKQWRQR